MWGLVEYTKDGHYFEHWFVAETLADALEIATAYVNDNGGVWIRCQWPVEFESEE